MAVLPPKWLQWLREGHRVAYKDYERNSAAAAQETVVNPKSTPVPADSIPQVPVRTVPELSRLPDYQEFSRFGASEKVRRAPEEARR